MWDLSKHERIEMEVLQGLNSQKILQHLIFCGGTMLRLCHGLNRYSVDLDFWILEKTAIEKVFDTINQYLKEHYRLRKAENKHTSLYFEFGLKGYPRHLIIEVRKDKEGVKYEEKIAFSKHSNIQVMVKAAALEEMMKAKIKTFLERARIRDAFDIEFILRRGIEIKANAEQIKGIESLIMRFKPNDYKITLGSLLEYKDRRHYRTANFRYLLENLKVNQIL